MEMTNTGLNGEGDRRKIKSLLRRMTFLVNCCEQSAQRGYTPNSWDLQEANALKWALERIARGEVVEKDIVKWFDNAVARLKDVQSLSGLQEYPASSSSPIAVKRASMSILSALKNLLAAWVSEGNNERNPVYRECVKIVESVKDADCN